MSHEKHQSLMDRHTKNRDAHGSEFSRRRAQPLAAKVIKLVSPPKRPKFPPPRRQDTYPISTRVTEHTDRGLGRIARLRDESQATFQRKLFEATVDVFERYESYAEEASRRGEIPITVTLTFQVSHGNQYRSLMLDKIVLHPSDEAKAAYRKQLRRYWPPNVVDDFMKRQHPEIGFSVDELLDRALHRKAKWFVNKTLSQIKQSLKEQP